MHSNKHVYLIDGNAYIYRAYHAITPLSNKQGVPTHATYGFTNIINRVIKEKEPQYLAIAFDSKGPTFRHDLYPEYKSNRPPMPDDLIVQIPYIKDIVKAHNILTLEMPDVEADDLLASAAKLLASQGATVTIVSGDKDLLQMVSEKISIWEPMNDKVIDREGVYAKYQVIPEKLNDLFALIGDKSDNIPGVPGIGPKTAEKLINEYGSLAGLYDSLDQLKKVKLRENLAKHKNDAILSKKLIHLKTDVNVPTSPTDYELPEPDQAKLNELYTFLGFTRLLKENIPTHSFDRQSFHLISDKKQLSKLVTNFDKSKYFAIDCETTSLDPLKAELVGLSIAVNKNKIYYLPISHCNNEGQIVEGQISLADAQTLIGPLLADPDLPKIGHNLKYDLAVLLEHDMPIRGPLLDTMLASYLLDPTRRTHKLDDICREFGFKMTSFKEVTNNAKREDCFRFVDITKAKDYSCEDIAAAIFLWESFLPQLEEQELTQLFSQIETPLIPVLAKMEKSGIRINHELLKELSIEFGAKIIELDEKITELAGKTFNISSPKQLAAVLFEDLQLPHGRKTKTGYSTDMKVLEQLALQHELPRLIIEHRNLSKLKSTYIDKLGTMVNKKTGRIHTSFNQTITATGRLSSSEPNLQNIPIRTNEGQRIREAFIPADGHVFIAADYSQIDLRVLAHYSDDKALIDAFCAGDDIHQKTAAEIFMVNASFVTGQMRRIAKSINFGIVYGMSAFGLANQLKISRKDAATFIARYFDHYLGVKNFMEATILQAREKGFVTTLSGRRRSVPDINSPNKTRREFAERIALNTPIQGTAADIVKKASIEVDRQLLAQNLKAKVLLQIHDELVLEVPIEEISQVRLLLKEAMENTYQLKVPLLVNISEGNNLAKT